MLLKARQFELTFPRPVMIMGILNVTPDSFSDGGRYCGDPSLAVERALQMVQQGADIIDLGGESTRPNSVPVPEEEELRRVLPVLKLLSRQCSVPVSIDTMKPQVAEAALDEGASFVNDVGANRSDSSMWRLVARSQAAYICMHMRGNPQTMQADPQYENVTGEVSQFFSDRLARLADCGVAPWQVILDPGIGFGKRLEHNLSLLGALGEFTKFGRPLLLGVSRKSFIEKAAGGAPADRLPGSLACACMAIQAGVHILRVHDVAETVQAARLTEAILASKKLMT